MNSRTALFAILVAALSLCSFLPKSGERKMTITYTVDNETTEVLGYVLLETSDGPDTLYVGASGNCSTDVDATVSEIVVGGEGVELPGSGNVTLPDEVVVKVASEGSSETIVTNSGGNSIIH